MIILNLLLFLASLFVLVKSAQYAVTYSSRIARVLHISEFVVSFFIIAVISCSPEATVSIISALKGIPEFGLGTLLGSNVADLYLVFGVVALFSIKGVTVKSDILKNNLFYLILLVVPIILGFDGFLSRTDGVLLILSGMIFFMTLAIESNMFKKKYNGTKSKKWFLNFVLLLISLVFMIGGAYYTVKFGVNFANDVNIPPVLVALTMVAIGSCLPELIFSINAVKRNHNELALGDVLGTVVIDATILVGVIALISPFAFNPNIIYVTGTSMFLASAFVIAFIKSGKVLSKTEGLILLMLYIFSIIIELIVNKIL